MSNDSDFGRPKILVVDDVPANIGVLRDALEGEGYRIAVARDGKGALHAAVSAAAVSLLPPPKPAAAGIVLVKLT